MQKQRAFGLGALGAILLVAGGCHQSASEDPSRAMTPRIRANDAAAARQLVAGFYGVENNAWRWTAGKFTVDLPVSDSARTSGATLTLKLFFPEPEMQQLGSTTLSASIGGVALPPETFAKSGDSTYTQDVPQSALAGATIRVDFALSKFMPGTSQDRRELGAVVHEISLKSK